MSRALLSGLFTCEVMRDNEKLFTNESKLVLRKQSM